MRHTHMLYCHFHSVREFPLDPALQCTVPQRERLTCCAVGTNLLWRGNDNSVRQIKDSSFRNLGTERAPHKDYNPRDKVPKYVMSKISSILYPIEYD